MSELSILLQSKSLDEMEGRHPYIRTLGHFKYHVRPKVYKGGTDTELFCRVLNVKPGQDVWDIGTGTGLIALQAKNDGARYVLATDINPDAVENAEENSRYLKLEIDVRKADVFGDIKKKFDLITFNPPFTDAQARRLHHMSFWDRGHKTLRIFLKGVRGHLRPKGRALVAWSSFGNTRKLRKIAKEYDLSLIEVAQKKGKRGFIYYVFEIVI